MRDEHRTVSCCCCGPSTTTATVLLRSRVHRRIVFYDLYCMCEMCGQMNIYASKDDQNHTNNCTSTYAHALNTLAQNTHKKYPVYESDALIDRWPSSRPEASSSCFSIITYTFNSAYSRSMRARVHPLANILLLHNSQSRAVVAVWSVCDQSRTISFHPTHQLNGARAFER